MTDEVRQEDREAAAVFADDVLTRWCAIGGNDVAAIRNGIWDDDDTDLGQIVQAFARHASPLRTRIAELEGENAALRHERASMWRAGVSDTVVIFDRLRQRINRVKWLKKNTALFNYDADLEDQFGKWFSFTRGKSPADYNETQDLRREFATLNGEKKHG